MTKRLVIALLCLTVPLGAVITASGCNGGSPLNPVEESGLPNSTENEENLLPDTTDNGENGESNAEETTENQNEENPTEEDTVEDESKYLTLVNPIKDSNIQTLLVNVARVMNYTVSETLIKDSTVKKKVKVTSSSVYFSDNENNLDAYLVTEDSNDFVVTFDSKNGNWTANLPDSYSAYGETLTKSNIQNFYFDFLNYISYKTYNTKTGEYLGTWKDFNGVTQEVSAYYFEDGTEGEFTVKDSNGSYMLKFYDLNKTEVNVPSYTKSEEVEKDETEIVCGLDAQNNYKFNYQLIKPILEEWLKGDNARNEDLMAQSANNVNCLTEQIVCMNLKQDKFELFVVYNDTSSNKRYVRAVCILDSNLYRMLGNNESLTEEAFENYIKSATNRVEATDTMDHSYQVDYITTDNLTTEQSTQFDALTEKIIERAKVVGTQGSDISNTGVPVDYSDYNIIAGLKTVPEGASSIRYACSGLNRPFDMVYLMEKDGEYKIVDFRLTSSVQRGNEYLYTNITDQDAATATNWMVVSVSEVEMESENAKLFNSAATTSYSLANYNAKDVVVDEKSL